MEPAELDQAMARGRGRLADDLIAEGLRVLEEGPLRKDEPGRGDVLSEQARAENRARRAILTAPRWAALTCRFVIKAWRPHS